MREAEMTETSVEQPAARPESVSGVADEAGPSGPRQAVTVPAEQQNAYRGGSRLRQQFPTVLYLREKARRRIPYFAFEYGDGGAGADRGIARNWAALDSVLLVPRIGVMPTLPPIETELFGRRYSAPFGIAPMGGPAIVWPGADRLLAAAAQRANVPYTLATTGGQTLEEAARHAPDVLWFQLGRMANNDHALGFDLVRRAGQVGVRVLALSVDGAVRTTRPREVHTGLGGRQFRLRPAMMAQAMRSPGWLRSLQRNGQPRFATMAQFLGGNASTNDILAFSRREIGGAFTWDEIARYRERWKGSLVLKGVMDPADADRAVSLGIDGVWVSNHGGRQLEAIPPTIDVLPAIAREVGGRATILMDSGVRSGLDVVRAIALGADGVFAGKAHLWGLGALGPQGPSHVLDLFADETKAALGLIGAKTASEARGVVVRHPGALEFPARGARTGSASAPSGTQR
jgi:L-lactate dehydrogenase (cytochrome)